MESQVPDTSGPASVPESAQAAYQFWKELDLAGLKSKLDGQGMALAQAQETSLQSRRQLAESTKELRRKLPKEVSKEVGPLLKAYQEEIDRLTNRAKAGEGAFVDLYQTLYDAPDPAPSLATVSDATQRMAAAEARSSRLARELAEYKQESASLRNQDLTIRRLEEKIRRLESAAEARARQAQELAKAAEEEAHEFAAAEGREREQRLVAAEAAVQALQRARTAAQAELLEAQGRAEEEREKLRAELDVAIGELERTQARLAFLEREHEQTLQRRQEERERSVAESVDRSGAEEALREELKVQRELAGRLRAELREAKEEAVAAVGAANRDLEAAHADLAKRAGQVADLETALAERPTQEDLAELRQQVRALQGLDFEEAGSGTDDENERSSSRTSRPGNGDVASALTERNRRLEHELTLARRAAEEATAGREAAEASTTQLASELEAAQKLANRLEEDLLVAQRQYRGAETNLQGQPSSSSPVVEEEGTLPHGSGSVLEDDPSLIAVLGSQRDRFRNRARELEEQVLVQGQDLAKLKRELEEARGDSLALAERLKYVQSYGQERSVDLERGADTVGRYMRQYEEGVNPFSAFRQRERMQAARNLPLTDRAAYRLTATMASSRFARFALLAYALLLHCVIFLVMARGVHSDSASIEASCKKMMAVGDAAALTNPGGSSQGNGTSVEAALRAVDPVTGGGGRRLLVRYLTAALGM